MLCVLCGRVCGVFAVCGAGFILYGVCVFMRVVFVFVWLVCLWDCGSVFVGGVCGSVLRLRVFLMVFVCWCVCICVEFCVCVVYVFVLGGGCLFCGVFEWGVCV